MPAKTARAIGIADSAAGIGTISEKQFQQQVVDYARLMGWRVFHAFDSRRSEPGFPDLTMVRDGQLVFAELKTERGKITEAQQEWLNRLQECADYERCHLWRPSDWPEIEKVLA